MTVIQLPAVKRASHSRERSAVHPRAQRPPPLPSHPLTAAGRLGRLFPPNSSSHRWPCTTPTPSASCPAGPFCLVLLWLPQNLQLCYSFCVLFLMDCIVSCFHVSLSSFCFVTKREDEDCFMDLNLWNTHENEADGWNVDIRIIRENLLCFGESTGVIWSCLLWEDLSPTLQDWAQILPRWSLGITVKGWLTLVPLLASFCLWLCIFCLLDLINLMTNSRKWDNSQLIPFSHFDTIV